MLKGTAQSQHSCKKQEIQLKNVHILLRIHRKAATLKMRDSFIHISFTHLLESGVKKLVPTFCFAPNTAEQAFCTHAQSTNLPAARTRRELQR